ncbi:MAG: ATP-binding protein [Phycisphaerae bacterium]
MSETATAPQNQAAKTPIKAEESMVVRLGQLDHMLELAGEVIIVSSNLNAVSRNIREGQAIDRMLSDNIKDLAITSSRISSDLHNLVTDVRTVDMSDMFARFRRLARDTSRRLGKAIRFEVEGESVNIDKKMSEKIYDPIAHQIRNAIDHGIEDAATRTAAGKEAEGAVTVRVLNKENNIIIQVEDDGGGIDVAAVQRKAIQVGLTDPDSAERMSKPDLLNYLFLPGFSTADAASVTSGRGVGMDVIRTVITEMGGETSIETAAGAGTTVSFILPKVTAVNISDALLITAGETHFAFPVNAVVASRSIPKAEISTVRGRSRTIMHLGQLLPLFDLLEILGEPPLAGDGDSVPVMIVEYKHRRAAFVVSDFLNPQKIVISEFDGIEVPGLSGTAVLSGRQLAMVIDLPRLFELTFGAEDAREMAQANKQTIPLGQAVEQVEQGQLQRPQTDEAPEGKPATEAAAQGDELPGDAPPAGEAPDAGFLHEVSAMLSRLNKSLLELEESRDGKQADAIFRLAHSIKGNLTMYGAETAAAVTHKAETLLEQARHGKMELDDEVFDILFDVAAYLEETVREFLAGRSGPCPSEKLQAALAAQQHQAEQAPQSGQADPSQAVIDLDATGEFYLSSRRRDGANLFRCNIEFEPADQPAYLVAYLILRRIQAVADVLGTQPSMSDIEAGRCGQTISVLLSPRESQPDLLQRLGENLQHYFGVLRYEANTYA